MKKTFYCITILTLGSSQLLQAESTALRCQVDSLNASEALGRNRYVNACYPDVIWKHAKLLKGRNPIDATEAWALVEKTLEKAGSRPLSRPYHYTPVFLNNPNTEAPIPWSAPKVGPTADEVANIQAYCSKPENVAPIDPVHGPIGFNLSYRCLSSCYAPEVRVFFKDSYIAMAEAFKSRPRKITVLSESATFENMSYRLAETDLWTISIRPEPHVLKVITLANGQSLRVTDNHPLVTSEGYFREAQDLKVGESLVKADGTAEPITEIRDQDYLGKVYNVQPKGKTAKGNIIVAEGFLSGSNFIQNEGYEFVHERIFRSELPMDLVN